MRSRVYALCLVLVLVGLATSYTIQARDVRNGIQCFTNHSPKYYEEPIKWRHAHGLIDRWTQAAQANPLNSSISTYGTAQAVITMNFESESSEVHADQVGLLSSDLPVANFLVAQALRAIFNKCCTSGGEFWGGSKTVDIYQQTGGTRSARISMQYHQPKIHCHQGSRHYEIELTDMEIVAENFKLAALSEDFISKSEWNLEVNQSVTPATFGSAKIEVKCDNGEEVCVIRAKDVADVANQIVVGCCNDDEDSRSCYGGSQNFVRGDSVISIALRNADVYGELY